MTLEENIRQANSDFVAIKEKIVECGVEVAEGTHTREYAPKINKVFEAGKKAEYDSFWDIYQQNGNRQSYYTAFAGEGWTNDTFKPKYDIRPIGTAMMLFVSSKIDGDLVEILDKQGVVLDTSMSTNLSNAFSVSLFTRIGVVDTRGVAALSQTWHASYYLETIDKVILNNAGTTSFNMTFSACNQLKNLLIEGVIGQNGFDVSASRGLSHDSIVSIINALSTTTSGLAVTLSKTAVNNAFSDTEWATLIATKSNWTINLV